VAGALYALNRLVLRPRIALVFLQGHLNDCLAGAALPAYFTLLVLLTGGRTTVAVRPLPILGLSLAAGLFWEFVTPLYLERSVSDPWDLVCYGCGSVAYLMLCRTRRGPCTA
jgi:membrane-associated PAP2 superfamily phosphatase